MGSEKESKPVSLPPTASNIEKMPVLGRTTSGGFKTHEGTLYVSRPFRSKTSKKLRALVSFTPRKSAFDTTNELSGANEFRGFFTLFWISMFLFTVRSYIRSMEENGHYIPMVFARQFSQDAITLAISDFLLVGSTALAVPFAMAIRDGWIKYYWTGVILQHIWQTALLGLAVTWTFNRQWPWVQSGFLTLHTLVMLMKVHSYLSVNGYLQHVDIQARKTLAELERLVEESTGGWDAAVSAANVRAAEINNRGTNGLSVQTGNGGHVLPHGDSEALLKAATLNSMDTSAAGSGNTTPDAVSEGPDGTTSSYIDATAAITLRRRLVSAASAPSSPVVDAPSLAKRFEQLTPPLPTGRIHLGDNLSNATAAPGADGAQPDSPAIHPLVDHPNEAIASLAREYSELTSELTSSGPEYVRWPANISFRNFAIYQLIPTLVYELEYPRTDRIRPLYVFEKTVATFGSFALLYTVTEMFIIPLKPTPEQSFFRSLLDLALPFMVAYLLLFYLIFECICNGFAELSYFADRQFYEDWWNSTSWDEFSRKWNRPVHSFLLRHVYGATINTYHISRNSAMFLTFLLSACVHELVMAIVSQKIRMYLFVLQLAQIPMIAIGRIPAIKRNKLAGNIVFWLGLYAGFPLLCVAYVAY